MPHLLIAFIYRSGIVADVFEDIIITIEGNTNFNRSLEGYGVFQPNRKTQISIPGLSTMDNSVQYFTLFIVNEHFNSLNASFKRN